MRIVQVAYRRLRSFGNFSNETVGATAAVEDGRDPGDVLDELRVWVDHNLGAAEERLGMAAEIDALRYRKDDLERAVAQLKLRHEAATKFLEAAGIPVPPRWLEDLPF
jgi:hypothetical protein